LEFFNRIDPERSDGVPDSRHRWAGKRTLEWLDCLEPPRRASSPGVEPGGARMGEARQNAIPHHWAGREGVSSNLPGD
jgi:hypothetical protein